MTPFPTPVTKVNYQNRSNRSKLQFIRRKISLLNYKFSNSVPRVARYFTLCKALYNVFCKPPNTVIWDGLKNKSTGRADRGVKEWITTPEGEVYGSQYTRYVSQRIMRAEGFTGRGVIDRFLLSLLTL